ncbi:hypothetical protein M0R36_10615 [bacterium]|jgi:hypothetical protein|nr:hypothetical protein [bacterium]
MSFRKVITYVCDICGKEESDKKKIDSKWLSFYVDKQSDEVTSISCHMAEDSPKHICGACLECFKLKNLKSDVDNEKTKYYCSNKMCGINTINTKPCEIVIEGRHATPEETCIIDNGTKVIWKRRCEVQ